MILLIQCIVGCLLFTLILIPAAKNPIKYLTMYPKGLQKAVRKLQQYQDLSSAKKSKAISIIVQPWVFIITGVFSVEKGI